MNDTWWHYSEISDHSEAIFLQKYSKQVSLDFGPFLLKIDSLKQLVIYGSWIRLLRLCLLSVNPAKFIQITSLILRQLA